MQVWVPKVQLTLLNSHRLWVITGLVFFSIELVLHK